MSTAKAQYLNFARATEPGDSCPDPGAHLPGICRMGKPLAFVTWAWVPQNVGARTHPLNLFLFLLY